MQLKFYAREGCLVTKPGVTRFVGQAEQYAGRRRVLGPNGKTSAYIGTRAPFAVDSDSEHAQRYVKHVLRGALWPADAETAAFCNTKATPELEFVAMSGADLGEWRERSVSKESPSVSTGGGGGRSRRAASEGGAES